MANRIDEGSWTGSGSAGPPRGRAVGRRAVLGGWRRQFAVGVTLTAVGALLVVAAGGLVLLRPTGDRGEAAAGAGASSGPTATGSANPSAGPSASAAAGKSVTFRYDGRRPTSDLDESLLPLPAFQQDGCPTGPTQFHSGRWESPSPDLPHPRAAISAVAVADVTGDGTPEHVTLVDCSAGGDPGSSAAQLFVLSGASGSFTVLGTVLNVSGGVTSLFAPQVQDGTVKVLVESRDAAQKPVSRQWREYKWGGSAFTQSGATIGTIQSGATRLTLSVKTTTVKLTGTAATGLHAEVAYTVTNAGGAPSTSLSVTVDSLMPLALTVPGSIAALARTDVGANHQWLFTIAPVAVNATVSGALLFAMDPAAVASAPASSQVNVAVYGVDIGTQQANASTADKGRLTVSRP